MSLITLFIGSILTGNAVLTEFLGVNSILGINKEKSALQMSFFIALMAIISTTITYLICHYILVPADIEFLKTILVVLIMIVFLPLMETLIKKYFKAIKNSFGKYISIIIVNCTVMGITLLNIQKGYAFTETLIFALGSSLGFVLILYVFSTLSERMSISPIIRSLRGFPITLITIGIMAMIFARYIGK